MPENKANIKNLLEQISSEIEHYALKPESIPSCNVFSDEISKAYSYPLKAGGKRIRPLLVLLASGAFGGNDAIQSALKSALAIEKIHTYSLVHDDLPCMDDDDLRRGLPTTHKVYGDAKALLVGDGLLTQAFALLAETQYTQSQNKHFTTYLLQALAKGAGPEGMVWGQWLDISLTGSSTVTWEQMEIVHRNKTGKLLGACLELGFICGVSALKSEISKEEFEKMRSLVRESGILIGLAFQIIDDILDITKSSAELGKTAGKDEIQFKMTAPNLLGIDKACELSQMHTLKALETLEEVFSDSIFTNNETNFSDYKALLIEQIQILLSRSN